MTGVGDAPGGELAVWPAVLRALVEGEQVVVVTTEAVPDGRLRLAVARGQQAGHLKPAYQAWVDAAGAAGLAEVTDRWEIDDGETVLRVLARTILDTDAARALPDGVLHVQTLRVWPGQGEGGPSLSDEMFESRRKAVREAVESG